MDYRDGMALQIKGMAEAIKKQAEQLGGYALNLGVYATDNNAEEKAHAIYDLADEISIQMTNIINKDKNE